MSTHTVVVILHNVPGRVTQGQVRDCGLIAADFLNAEVESAQVVREVDPASFFRRLRSACARLTRTTISPARTVGHGS